MLFSSLKIFLQGKVICAVNRLIAFPRKGLDFIGYQLRNADTSMKYLYKLIKILIKVTSVNILALTYLIIYFFLLLLKTINNNVCALRFNRVINLHKSSML